MPVNVTATTSMAQAIAGAQYAVHAVPVQHSRAFLTSVKVGSPHLMHLRRPRKAHAWSSTSQHDVSMPAGRLPDRWVRAPSRRNPDAELPAAL